jgi:hypothetical protein
MRTITESDKHMTKFKEVFDYILLGLLMFAAASFVLFVITRN